MGGWLLLLLASSSATLTMACAALVWRPRPHPAARAFASFMIAETVCSIGYVAELLARGLEAKLLWDNVQYVAWIAMAPLSLWFAWEYTQTVPKRLGRALGLFLVIPVLAGLWVFTDPIHKLARGSAHIVESPPFDLLLYDFTLPELLFILQTYMAGAYIITIVFRSVAEQSRELWWQASLVALGLALPMIVAMFSLATPELFGQRDVAPISFGIAALPVAWALHRGRFLDVVPVARHVVFAQLPDPVLVLDAEDRIIDANPAGRALLGTEKVLRSELPPTFRNAPEPLTAGESNYALDLDGRAFDVSVKPMRDGVKGGGRVMLMRDVTGRMRAERELLRSQEVLEERVRERTRELHARVLEKEEAQRAAFESEQRFRVLVEGATQLMGMLTGDGRVVTANRAALEFAGVSEQEVVGKPFWETPWWGHSEERRERVRTAVARAASGEHVHLEVTHVDADGSPHPFDFSLKPLGSEHGVMLLLAEGRDMSEHRRAEQERLMLREQLHHAQRLDSIGRLAGGIAHDFNNLLTVMLGHIELARLDMLHGKHRLEHLEQAALAGDSAAGITRQLLMFARRQPTDPRVLDLNEIVRQTHRMLRRLIREDIEIDLELGSDLRHVFADTTQIEQVVLNLALNARDAMEHGGKLTIATHNVGPDTPLPEARGAHRLGKGYVKLTVRDTGIGMSEQVLSHIFEPFFTTKTSGKGTGIGLATVDHVVRASGGFIAVESTPGAGTSFDVYLPDTSAEVGSERPHEHDVPTGSERVALVEDQVGVRQLAEEQLRQLGYQVRNFASAEEAFSALSRDPTSVDLVITDIVLSGASGPTLVERLRALRPQLPVLYVSGYVDDMEVGRGSEIRSAPLLHKPFTLQNLAHAIRRVLAH